MKIPTICLWMTLLMAGQAWSQTTNCPTGLQPFGNRCVSQRMGDYISCVEASGANRQELIESLASSQGTRAGGDAKASAKGPVIAGGGSVSLSKSGEAEIMRRIEGRWFPGGMSECGKVLAEPPPNPKSSQSDFPPKHDFSTIESIRGAMSRLADTSYKGTDYDYWPNGGLRNSYFHFISLITASALQSNFGGKAFLSGPHSREALNFNSKYDFGRYNPRFVNWLTVNANLALGPPEFIDSTRPLYEKYLRSLILNYFYVKLYLDTNPLLKSKLQDEYAKLIKTKTLPDSYIQQVTFVEQWGKGMPAKDIENAVKKLKEEGRDLTAGLPYYFGSTALTHSQQHILARDEYVRSALQRLMQGGDSNILAPAVYFWLRRSMDHTEQQFHEMLLTVISKYEPSAANNLRIKVLNTR